jgi:4-amino-4-deoxy-L-arabinose transferase-like glycosyltransferase
MKMKEKILLWLILTLAVILRFWNLGSYPAFNADEAALGYNACSLLETGMDEHGNPWPIHFQSFNDFKPGGYIYMILPFVKLFGLSIWSVRFLAAFLGVGTVLMVFLLVDDLYKNKNTLSLISALMLAISPWHIHFSRGAWEVNVATFFILLGVWLFVRAVKDKRYYWLSMLSFSLSLYTYHSARLITPLLGLGLLVIYRDKVLQHIRSLVVAGLIGLIAILPLGMDVFRGAVFSRAAGVGLLADTGPLSRIEEQRGEHADFTSVGSKLLHNKPVNYGLAFVENWAEHYDGEFLFESGEEIQRNRVPETGQMYMIDIVWVVVGLWWISKNWRNRGNKLIVYWLMIAPIAAAFTFQSPHALRSQNMVIPLIIIAAIGFYQILEWLKNKNGYYFKFGFWLLLMLVAWSFARYQIMYWGHMSREYPFSSQYGVQEMVDFVESKQVDFDKVIITDRYDQPYILYLFFTKYPPAKFQQEHVLTVPGNYGFSTVRSFGKYEFVSVDYDKMQPENPRSLIIGTDEEIPDEANIIKNIYGTNGYLYFQVVAN